MTFLDKSQIVVYALSDGAVVAQRLGVKDVFTQIAKDVVGQGLDHALAQIDRPSLPGFIRLKMADSRRKRFSALEPVQSQLWDCLLGCGQGKRKAKELEISSELTIRGRNEEEAIVRCTSSARERERVLGEKIIERFVIGTLFSEDPAHLERTICKDQRSTSLDAAAFTSTDSRTQPSTDIQPSSSTDLHRSTSIDTTPRTSIHHQSRNMVAIVILRQDENGNLYDQDGHLRNATGQKLDAQGNSSRTSIDIKSTNPHPAKRSYASIDTTPGTSIDIKTAALKKEKGNIPISSKFTNTYIRSFAPQITYHDTEAEKMNALTNQSEGTSSKSIRSKNPNLANKRLPSIDTPISTSIDSHSKPKLSLFTKKNMSIDYGFLTPDEFGIFRDPDGHARSMDGRILQVSREDISDILQEANGADNFFMQQRSIPDNIPAVPDEYPRADTTEIGSHQSCRPVGQASIDKVAPTSFDRVTPMSLDKAPSPSIDRRYEFGHRAYDIYGARKFRWEQKDEYGVYRDESGYARSVAGEMIPVTKDNIRKILKRAFLFDESQLCLPEHATFFTPTKLAPEIYTKDEINEMVTGICGAQEKLGDELKTLVDDIYQPLDRGYNELFRTMAEMRTEIESMQHNLEKEATTSPLIDANKATSIDVKPQTSQIPAEPESLTEKKDEWEIAYINTGINDVYNPLKNNVDWLSTRIDLLQQDFDTIRKKDPQLAINRYLHHHIDRQQVRSHGR
ncbi:hypothetical protein F2Q69_00022348 [Brassica cretica]|uniref:Uncharacterized protein n=1 Tax=Brassica cretica TaxID=69181 RepID=A0A8S9QAX4_BRACR|nr:hypothetical protein F2Q69_00022348 [Brassica cretica]